MAEAIADQERAMGARLAECWHDVVDASVETQDVAVSVSQR